MKKSRRKRRKQFGPPRARPEVALFLRNVLERLMGRYYEGPAPPPRMFEEVLLFRRLHPDATADDWASFTTRLAEGAYRDGFIRCLERELRDPDTGTVDDELAERIAHSWSIADSYEHDKAARELAGFDPNDPYQGLPEEARAALFDHQGLVGGTHRVLHPSVLEEDLPLGDGWVETARKPW